MASPLTKICHYTHTHTPFTALQLIDILLCKELGRAACTECGCVYAQSFSQVWLCDPMDCSLPGSSVHGIIPARILGCHFLLQGNFFRQGSNQCLLCLLHWQADSFTTEPRLALNSVQLNSKVYLMHYNSPTLHKLFLPQSFRGFLGKSLRGSTGILRSRCALLKTSSTSTEHNAEVVPEVCHHETEGAPTLQQPLPEGKNPKCSCLFATFAWTQETHFNSHLPTSESQYQDKKLLASISSKIFISECLTLESYYYNSNKFALKCTYLAVLCDGFITLYAAQSPEIVT